MANKRRGEVDVMLGGQAYRMCLTLGALAELEAVFGDEDMMALASRFETGRLRSEDAIRILGAGLRGAGHDLTDDRVAAMPCDRGATGYVAAVADLLQATFGGVTDGAIDPEVEKRHSLSAAPQEERRPAPFPGKT